MSSAAADALSLREPLTASADDFNTPEEVLDLVTEFGGGRIGLDPCSNPHSIVGAEVEWSLENGDDGLAHEWQGNGVVFVNPPYSIGNQAKWVAKCCVEAKDGAEIIALVQARTDSHWFARIFEEAQAICFWRGRISFIGGESCARMGSVLAYWGTRAHLFAHVFRDAGKVIVNQ